MTIRSEGTQFQCDITRDEDLEVKNSMQKWRFASNRDYLVKISRLVNSGAIDEQLKKYFGQGFGK